MTRLERLGAGMSLACAVHCAATPLLVGALPLVGHQLSEAHWVEALVIGGAAAIGYLTLGFSFRRHGKAFPLLLFSLGLVLVLFGHTPAFHAGETALMVTGALLLAGAQLLNRRYPVGCCEGH